MSSEVANVLTSLCQSRTDCKAQHLIDCNEPLFSNGPNPDFDGDELTVAHLKSVESLAGTTVKIRLDIGSDMLVKVPDATMLKALSESLTTRSKPGMFRKRKRGVTAIRLQNCQTVNKSSDAVLTSKHGIMANPNHFSDSQAEVCVTLDSIAKRGLYSVLLRKPSKSFIHKAKRGFVALRINGLLKQKCKKGSRKHYPIKVFIERSRG